MCINILPYPSAPSRDPGMDASQLGYKQEIEPLQQELQKKDAEIQRMKEVPQSKNDTDYTAKK